MDSLSSPEVVIRGIIAVIAMVVVPPGLYVVSHGVDILDVVILFWAKIALIS